MSRRYLILAAMGAFVLVAAAAASLGFTFFDLPDGPIKSGVAAIGGPFALVDDQGKPVTEKALAGRPYAMYFGYTYCPEVCPTTLFDLSRWIKVLGPEADKLNYVFVSVDPERDTVQLMNTYLSSFDKHIRGYTGTQEQIAKIAKEYRVYYKKIPTDDGGYVMDHSAMIYLMGPDEKFVTLIRYQEDDASALAKLKKLVAMAPVS